MRLITDEQHAQIVEALDIAYAHVNDGYVEDRVITPALATLQALPEVEVVAFHEPHAYGNVTCYPAWAEANGWIPLYATKEPS